MTDPPRGRVVFKSVLVAPNSKVCSLEYLQLDYRTRTRRTRLSNVSVLAKSCATHGFTTWRFDGREGTYFWVVSSHPPCIERYEGTRVRGETTSDSCGQYLRHHWVDTWNSLFVMVIKVTERIFNPSAKNVIKAFSIWAYLTSTWTTI